MKAMKKRMIAKAVTWKMIGLAVISGLTYWLTGNLATSGKLSVGFLIVSFVLYVIHEWIWEHVQWGKEKR